MVKNRKKGNGLYLNNPIGKDLIVKKKLSKTNVTEQTSYL
jgi:hypothetical protein